jgi:hypothetical protein
MDYFLIAKLDYFSVGIYTPPFPHYHSVTILQFSRRMTAICCYGHAEDMDRFENFDTVALKKNRVYLHICKICSKFAPKFGKKQFCTILNNFEQY